MLDAQTSNIQDSFLGSFENDAAVIADEPGFHFPNLSVVTPMTVDSIKAFGTLRDGIDVQIRTFGERLDHGVKATDESVTAISTKLTHDMEQMRAEANTGRENLRGLIEQKLEQNIGQQSDSAKVLREELGGNFERLGIRVTESLAETGRIQLERLENVITALGLLTEKSEKAQESLRLTVEGRLDAIRQDNAVKLDEMRQTVDEKPPYSTRYRKAKASKGLTGSFGDRSWPRKAII